MIDGLRRLGAFGIKIPKEYGGLGLNHVEYGRVMTLLGSHCGNVASLLSAHQSIGVPAPLLVFGTEEQKRQVPAALRERRDLGLRAHRARGRLRPGPRARPLPRRRPTARATS